MNAAMTLPAVHQAGPAKTQKYETVLSIVAFVLVATLIFSSVVLAGGTASGGGSGTPGGAEFNPIVDWLIGSLQGGLGKLLALGAFTVGLGYGVAKQSLMAAAIGIGFAIVVYFGPTIIVNLVSAAI